MIAVAKKLRYINIDETGNRYGRLSVVSRAPSGKNGSRWLCWCDCGTEKVIHGGSLRAGTTRSCGCLQRELQLLPKGEAAFNSLYSNRKLQAKARNKEFDLTKEQVRNLSIQNCNYCGAPPTQVYKTTNSNGSFLYNGLDRIDNSLGYVEGNVVPSCGRCNIAKHIMGVEEFKSWITQVYKHFVEGQSI